MSSRDDGWSVVFIQFAVLAWMFLYLFADDEKDLKAQDFSAAYQTVDVDTSTLVLLGAGKDVKNGRLVALQTDNWMMLNGGPGTQSCEAVLGGFAASYQLVGYFWKHQAIQVGLEKWQGTHKKFSLVIPEFKSEPAGLSGCFGYSYSPETHRLSVNGLPVAFLSPTQPDWHEVPSEQ